MPFLYEQLDTLRDFGSYTEIPPYIQENVNQRFELRPYQIGAFENFITYFENEKMCRKPTQTLFHMATGSGKTMIMAGLMLYLYKKGYRNFLFFVNLSNIVNKTRENFLNALSSKYLFADEIRLNGERVQIKEVSNFQYSDDDAINICFTTTQGLHSDMWTAKENSISYDDFADKKVVLISDEAHHLNVDTKTLEKNNIKTVFKGGYRVTDEKSIKLVEEVLSGGVNKDIVQGLKNEGLNACGISGKDASLITAVKKEIPEGDIGFVGNITNVNPQLLKLLLENDYVPVISPISSSAKGETLNVNADDAAFSVAEALQVDTLMFLTDVDGILLDVSNSGTVINTISHTKAKELMENGFIAGGMLPKLKSCIHSIENGVNEVAIVNGSVKYNLVTYFITKGKIGTTINNGVE